MNNLGCTYVRLGWIHSGIETWTMATKVAPDYDVTFYNIASHFRTNGKVAMEQGQFDQALEFYKNSLQYFDGALRVKRCHFVEAWTKEREEIFGYVSNPPSMIINEHKRLSELKLKLIAMDKEAKDPKRKAEVSQSMVDCERNLLICTDLLKQNGIILAPAPTA